MKRAVAIVGLVFLTASVCAQTSTVMTAKIPFDFVAGKTTMPAGDYEFRRIGEDVIRIMSLSTHKSIVVQTLTRLAADTSGKARVTFDVIGERRMLESVWPGGDEGYLLGVTKAKHTHHTVTAG